MILPVGHLVIALSIMAGVFLPFTKNVTIKAPPYPWLGKIILCLVDLRNAAGVKVIKKVDDYLSIYLLA